MTKDATGALVNGIPLICGGYPSSDECYQITTSMTSVVTKMNSRRYGADSVVVHNYILWILGGRKDDYTYLSTTEYVQIGAGPDLPLAVSEHAIVAWNASTFMLIGGQDGVVNLAKTFYFYEDMPSEEWIPGPKLNQARSSHAVGLGMDTATSEQYIVVTGGKHNDEEHWMSVELLFEGMTDWIDGKIQYFIIQGVLA